MISSIHGGRKSSRFSSQLTYFPQSCISSEGKHAVEKSLKSITTTWVRRALYLLLLFRENLLPGLHWANSSRGSWCTKGVDHGSLRVSPTSRIDGYRGLETTKGPASLENFDPVAFGTRPKYNLFPYYVTHES